MSTSIATAVAVAALSAGGMEEPACPAKNFADFAIAFSNSVDIQRQWTQDSVRIVHRVYPNSDDGNNTEETVSVAERKTLSFPLIPTFKELTSLNSSVQISSRKIVHGGDGGWSKNYIFDNTPNGCWKLSSIEESDF